MEDEERIQAPYYAMTYIDDYDTKHLTNLKNEEDVRFISNRFNVLQCEYILK